MSIDHSLTYKKFKFKNLPHRLRLSKIVQTLKNMGRPFLTFVDVGCSNGYITNIITKEFHFEKVKGLDYVEANLKKGEEDYPHISFDKIDLNLPLPDSLKSGYDLITCFETLEHVGNLDNAVRNIIKLGKTNSNILITVPIEIGFWGITKFLLKRFIYKGYTLQELGAVKNSEYLSSLIRGESISSYRDSDRKGWGTHFGFDYRDVDIILENEGISFKANNYFTTRFYTIYLPNQY